MCVSVRVCVGQRALVIRVCAQCVCSGVRVHVCVDVYWFVYIAAWVCPCDQCAFVVCALVCEGVGIVCAYVCACVCACVCNMICARACEACT